MYQTIWKDYRERFFKANPRLPREKTFSIGRALWAISRRKRMKFIELSWKSGVDEGTLLGMAASHKLTCPTDKIKKIADALGVSLEEFFFAAREEYFGSLFVCKTILPAEKEIRTI